MTQRDVVILGAARSPIGSFGGSLAFTLTLELERLFLGAQLGGLLFEQEPLTRIVLTKVTRIGFRYFDGQQWREQWPPVNVSPKPLRALPRPVEFSLETGDYGVITRLVDLPEVDEVAPAGTPAPPPGLPP